MNTIIALVLFASAALAQTSRSVTLNWTDPTNPAGTTYNVFKAPSACASNPTTYARIASAVAAKTYLDQNVPIGAYCYYVTAVYASMESGRSPTALAAVTPVPPSGLITSTTVDVTVTVTTTQSQQPQAQPQQQQPQQQQQQPEKQPEEQPEQQ